MHKSQFRRIGCILNCLFFLLLAGNLFAATVEPPKNPNSAKGCAICHYRWIDTFFIEGRGTDLVPYQAEKVAATQDMCISCHDGSVMDSREKILHGHSHKTDAAPPAGMKIPETFPLDEAGKVQCATCHTAHGVESGPGVKETIFLRMSNRDSAMCKACHPDKDGGTAAGNHSLNAGDKKIPRSLKSAGAREGSMENQVICQTCHVAHGAPREGYLVIGAGDSGLCLTCHTDKNMIDASGRRNDNHAINMKPRTATITESLLQKGAKLGYDGVFTCQTCHKIHNNHPKEPALLFLNNRKADLCLACHPDKERLSGTKHNLAISAKTEKNLQGETAGEAGMCSACHLPHKPARKPFEEAGAPARNQDRTTALCLSCHAEGRIAGNKKLTGYSHPVDVSVPDPAGGSGARRNRAIAHGEKGLDLPLFNESGVMDKNGMITCATCHDTHGGPETDTAPSPQGGEGFVETTFLRKSSPSLCKSCHADKFSVENTRHNLDSVFPNGNAVLKQKVPESDLCRNCHYIHDSEPEGFVWGEKIVTDAGSGAVDKCGACHRKGGMADGKVIRENSHPVNVGLPDAMETGTLPLFDASGNVTDKGMMTCYTCHDPHRRSPVKSKNGEAVLSDEGRPVNPFLRIDSAPDSDLCIDCHKDKEEVRKTDHNLIVTAPDAKNISGRTTFESGVCMACHLVHDGTGGPDLWALDPGEGESMMDRMCNSCHSENGAAADKVPQISSHPETLFVNKMESGGTKMSFPLFDKTTGEAVTKGALSCPSCHDAHHWGATPPAGGITRKIEGNAASSFLRPHLPDRVCRQCHGPEGLFVFKYFHKADERKKIKPDVPRGVAETDK